MSDSAYRMVLLPGAFTDMFGTTNDTMKMNFSVLEPTYFGTLKLDAKISTQGHYILQLLDIKNNVSRQQLRYHGVLRDQVEERGHGAEPAVLAGEGGGEIEPEAVGVHLGQPVRSESMVGRSVTGSPGIDALPVPIVS